jgi:hypothetical protein
MTVASSMLKGFFGSGQTRSGTVIQKAASGELPGTPTVPATTVDASNVDMPTNADMPVVPEIDAEDIIDTTKPINRERTSSESFDNRNYNLTNVTDSDELVSIIDNIGRASDNFKKARGGGPQPHKDVVKKAKKSDITELEKIIGYRLGDGVTAERVYGGRQLLQESANNLKIMADTVLSGQANDVFKLKFRQAISSHVGIQQAVAGMAADSGRSLNAWRIPAGSNVSNESTIYRGQLQDMISKGGGNETINKLAQAILEFDDLEKVTKAAEKMHFATKSDIVLEIWINGLLSNPTTHVVNSGSNALVAVTSIPERFAAATVSAIARRQDGVKYGEVVAQMWGLIHGVRDGWTLSAKALRTGEPTDPSMKYEARKYNSFSSENINNQLPNFMQMSPDGHIAKSVDLFGDWFVRLPTKFLGAEDEFFKTINYRMELNALAYRTAKNEGLDGAEFAARVKDLIENPTEKIHLGANDFARQNTFTNDLGEQGKVVQNAINQIPAAKIIAPFVRTPTNIVKYVFNRLPPTPFTKTMNADLKAGGVRKDVALARVGLGSLTMGVITTFAMDGTLTGSGPANADARRALMLTGWQPYSIFKNGKYYSYKRTDPIGMFLGMAADVTDVLRYGDQTQGTDVALAATMALAKNLQDKTYMQGVAAAVQAMEDPDRYLEGWLKRTSTGFLIPYSSLVGQVEKTGDPTLRVANTLLEKVRAKIPIMSEKLPPRRNLWGEPIVLNGAWGWEMVSPIYYSEDVNDPVANEIVAQGVPVRKQVTKIRAGNGQIELSLEESDRLAVLTGKEIKWDGLNLHAFLEYEMNTPAYAAMTDGPDGEKALTIRGIINDFREEAEDQLLIEYPDLQKKIEKAEDEKETLLGY